MQYIKFFMFISVVALQMQCTTDQDEPIVIDKTCTENDKELIIGSWGEPRFISNSSNCHNECIEIEFTVNEDSTYHLVYTIDYGSQTADFEFDDRGKYVSNCIEASTGNSPFGAFRRINWNFEFNSDSLATYEWPLEYMGLEGLIIQPQTLNLSGEAYVILKRN